MIEQFQGKYRWLSNFTPVDITLRGIVYPSVEHAFVSEKSSDAGWKLYCSDKNNTPSMVKKAGRRVELVSGWDKKKIIVMKACLRQKFAKEPFRSLLIETGNEYIQEGNYWHDTFWGVDLRTGEGKNVLGKLIMEIRDTIINNGD